MGDLLRLLSLGRRDLKFVDLWICDRFFLIVTRLIGLLDPARHETSHEMRELYRERHGIQVLSMNRFSMILEIASVNFEL